jgi:signal transduction histidine kinase
MQVYRIAQEAINNTLKHSKATRIDMSLYAREGRLDLTIKDNGIGINRASGKPSGGMGLRIMEFRARMINATLDLRQPPEGGTLVLCTLRLASPEPTGGSP